jgi:hypothetical protein
MAIITAEDIKRWHGSTKCDKCGRWVGVGGWFTTDPESGHVDEVLCQKCAPKWTKPEDKGASILFVNFHEVRS